MNKINRLYEINTVVWLDDLSKTYGRKLTLEEIPAQEWQKIKDLGFDSIWLMGVWQRSDVAKRINLEDSQFMNQIKFSP